MNAKAEKIARIKKSCKIGKVISRILMIICIVGVVVSIFSLIATLVCKDNLAEWLEISSSDMPTNEAGGIDSGDIEGEGVLASLILDPMVKDAELTKQLTVICAYASVICALGAFVWFFFGQVFAVIQKEESPFADTVMNKLKINFILLTVMLGISIGIGAAVVAAFLFWCIYSIFDYGRLLQIESDETL